MNGFPSREQVERAKARFPRGARVMLDSMEDDHAPQPGTMGTVMFVDDIGSVHVSWDNGSCLAVLCGTDSCHLAE